MSARSRLRGERHCGATAACSVVGAMPPPARPRALFQLFDWYRVGWFSSLDWCRTSLNWFPSSIVVVWSRLNLLPSFDWGRVNWLSWTDRGRVN